MYPRCEALYGAPVDPGATGTGAADDRFPGRSFDELEVGTHVVTRARTLTDADLVNFSALTGDWHPAHSDAAWAARTPFGERIAHGMLLLSYAVGLMSFDSRWVVAMRSVDGCFFKRPGRLGDTIHVDARIAALDPADDDRGIVRMALEIWSDTDVLALARLSIVWRRRTGSD